MTNTVRESITNYIVTTAKGKSLFLSANASKANSHTAEYLCNEMKKVIEDVGPKNVNAICTDNAANITKAVRDVVKIYPHIHQIPGRNQQQQRPQNLVLISSLHPHQKGDHQ